jgi:indolepyruvate ferredoxin oxidoreductase
MPQKTGAPAAARIIPMPETLDQIVARNQQWLTEYQNARYAKRYATAVERIRAREASLQPGNANRLTRAVAVNLAKLMAYKDEYEVARLYTDPAFTAGLREQFDGEPGKDYTLTFHLAPPLLARKNEKGQLIKRSYGPWMLSAFRVLAKLKGLRGSPLDIFGKTEERRMERQLIADYLDLVNELADSVTEKNLAVAIELARLPDDIRGFGHVKEANVQAAQARRSELLASYRNRHPQPSQPGVAINA